MSKAKRPTQTPSRSRRVAASPIPPRLPELGGKSPRQWLQDWLTRWFGDDLPNAPEKIDELLGVYDRSSLLQ